MDDPSSNRQSELADELADATIHSGVISPVFGDIAAKMQLAINDEIQRLWSIGATAIVNRGNGIEQLYSLTNE
jgi:hypothetical protein